MIVELLNSEVVNIYSAEPTNRNVNYTYVNAPYVPIVLNDNQIRIGLKYENDVVTDIVQDLTSEESNATNKTKYLEKLIELVNNLDKRILISSVNKEESDIEYLKNQTERYLEKYKVAKQYVDSLGVVISDQVWYDAIVSELNETNTIQSVNMSIMDFMQLIVGYYENGEFRNKKFQVALERFRAKTKDFILVHNWVKADECMNLALTLPNAMSLQDLDNKLIELEAI